MVVRKIFGSEQATIDGGICIMKDLRLVFIVFRSDYVASNGRAIVNNVGSARIT